MKKITLMQLLFAWQFALLLSSCKKEENKQFTDSPIVESYLSPGSYVTATISRQIPFASDVEYSADDINNLALYISYNSTVRQLTSLGDGKYVDSGTVVLEGIDYTLSFVYNSKDVSAFTYVPTKPATVTQSATEMEITRIEASSGPPSGGIPTDPDPIEIQWNNSDASYYLITVENIESTLDPIRDFGDEAPPANIFRKSPTTSSASELRSRDFQYYGTHRIILYHVLPDYASLYEQSSTSSQNLTNPSSSITNGYGIFTGLNSDTVFVEIVEP